MVVKITLALFGLVVLLWSGSVMFAEHRRGQKADKLIVKYTCDPWKKAANRFSGGGGFGGGSGYASWWFYNMWSCWNWLHSIPVGEVEHLA